MQLHVRRLRHADTDVRAGLGHAAARSVAELGPPANWPVPDGNGSFSFTISASNSAGPVDTSKIIVKVGPAAVAPAFSGGAPPAAAKVGTANSFTVTASGQPTPTYHVRNGSLPASLKLSSGGVLAGTPTNVATPHLLRQRDEPGGNGNDGGRTNTTSKRIDRA